ncbi:cardiolipin synthase [Harryflintia acetispora]|uniref:Cardiolipin synthase n=1 Tax=Harryflintia acetispora TaxID=1849041 RepID=A0A9X8UG69_9FIRM|nr:cardiolipin synthase [Harryflintia acetispora]
MIKKLLKFLTSRMVIVAVLILLQMAFVVNLVVYLSSASVYVYSLLELVSAASVIWLVSKNENPSYKLAWVILIMAFPIVGIVFYLMFGDKRMSKGLSRKIEGYYKDILPFVEEQSHKGVGRSLGEEDAFLGRQAAYITRISGAPVFQNTSVQYCELGEVKFRYLLEELQKARHFIFLEYFIIEPGKMFGDVLKILQQKVREGVEVRLMYDDLGSIQTVPPGYDKVLASSGIRVCVFNPFRPHVNSVLNYRDHRKICVIDGNVGFTGGINLADEYINAYQKHGHWKDTAVMLKGEAVWNLTLLFMQLWCFSTGDEFDVERYRPTVEAESDGYVQPFGDSPLDSLNVAENAYMQIINGATNYVYITTPYLILDNEMLGALTLAAQSGVDVRIMTPHVPDKWFVHPVTRSFYLPLIKAGVKIYEYSPGFVHAKMFVADDKVAIVGTTNMDYRSFYLHFECGVAFYFSKVVGAVKQDILDTLQRCELITEKKAGARWYVRLGRALLRIFAPLM